MKIITIDNKEITVPFVYLHNDNDDDNDVNVIKYTCFKKLDETFIICDVIPQLQLEKYYKIEVSIKRIFFIDIDLVDDISIDKYYHIINIMYDNQINKSLYDLIYLTLNQ